MKVFIEHYRDHPTAFDIVMVHLLSPTAIRRNNDAYLIALANSLLEYDRPDVPVGPDGMRIRLQIGDFQQFLNAPPRESGWERLHRCRVPQEFAPGKLWIDVKVLWEIAQHLPQGTVMFPGLFVVHQWGEQPEMQPGYCTI
jgi:hypothetical protein